jgi:PAS domain S-box-containing protein
MNENETHEELMRRISAQQSKILESSGQAIYIYLDDSHIVYNQKFASLVGYASTSELDAIKGSFVPVLVAEKSQSALVEAYQKAMDKLSASTVEVFFKKKAGGEVKTTVILAPLMYDSRLFAIHFIS